MGLFTMVGLGQEHDSSYKYIKIAAPWVDQLLIKN
jgi:hypothetical protein